MPTGNTTIQLLLAVLAGALAASLIHVLVNYLAPKKQPFRLISFTWLALKNIRGLLKILIFMMACATISTGWSQGQSNLVTHYGPEQGFTTASVNDILRDSKGLMWFATIAGLYRFDGYTFDVFKPDDRDSLSLSDVFIRHLYEDSRGFIWVGTLHGGLCRFDPRNGTFYRFHHPSDSIGGNTQINGMAEDTTGNIWVASIRGLHRFSYETGWSHFRFSERQLPASFRNRPFSIHISSNGTIWLGYARRTFGSFNPVNGQFKHYNFNSVPYSGSGLIRSIAEDTDGELWMTAIDGGLLRFDPRKEECTFLFDTGTLKYSVGIAGNQRVFTAGQEGLMVLDKKNPDLVKSFHNPFYKLGGSASYSLLLESDHVVWLGTANQGVVRIQLVPSLSIEPAPFGDSPLTNIVKSNGTHFYGYPGQSVIFLMHDSTQGRLHHNQTTYQINEGDRLNDALLDRAGTIWLALNQEVVKLTERGEVRERFRHDLSNTNSLPAGGISSLLLDSHSTLWVGSSLGWSSYDFASGNFESFKKPTGSVTQDLAETTEGIWISTADGGLAFFDRVSREIKDHRHSTKDSTTISNDYVSSLHVDRNGTLWAGTLSGLDRYNAATQNFTRFQLQTRERAVYHLDKDNKGNLLVQTKDGIYRAMLSSKSDIESIHKIHGPVNLAHGYGFLHYPLFTWQESDHLAECHLDSISPPSNPPHIVITGFALDPNNRNPMHAEEARLNPVYRSHIELEYDQNLFSIEFSALDFSDPLKNEYSYQLEGLDKAWTSSGTRHFVTYTNLDPGDYVFRVKGANAYGVWSVEPSTLSITIHPPIWRTSLAYVIYAIAALMLLLLARRNTINRERLKAQVAIEQAEKAALKDLDHLKTKFFSNITHEFRTPLTLIQGPAKELYDSEPNPESRQLLGMIRNNAGRLLKLINQLLDLAKLDGKEMKLALSPASLERMVRTTFAHFTSLASSKGIDYKLVVPKPLPTVLVDSDKLETIITNLLSNAIKFTSAGGMVSMESTYTSGNFVLAIRDTGKGIPPEKLSHIFDRFYQVDPTDSSHAEGTGIGLALVKEYVELMKGFLEVDSLEGTGTNFNIKLSLREIPDQPMEVPVASNATPIDLPNTSHQDAIPSGSLPMLLLVEDNEDIRTFIKSCLGPGYTFGEARDGKEGLAIARTIIPDLIISDWMMPEMDGVEFCRQVKKDKRTDHIPFIMLTAKAAFESKIEGLQTGADDYLIKPFNKEELVLRIQNLIKAREKLQARIKQHLLSQSTPVQATSQKEQFIVKARSYVEMNLGNEKLGVESLAEEMNLSREQCYRKIIALTGLSPSGLIRKLRLQHAAQLLSAGAASVSQVAFEVGYNNLSHFSKAFKEEFGKLPSDYSS